jgi:hypothetical protein
VRLSSERLAVAKTTPTRVREVLLPVLERNAAPTVRLLALRARRHGGKAVLAEVLTAATLDPNAADGMVNFVECRDDNNESDEVAPSCTAG